MCSTRFEHPNVQPQEDLYVQFYGISFMHPYKQSGHWKDVLKRKAVQSMEGRARVHPSIDRTAYMDA